MAKNLQIYSLCLLLALFATPALAQFNLDGQLIQRAEFRNGFGRLINENQDPAAFIAHRARLQAGYQLEGFTFQASIQDVRTWGNTPQIKLTDNFLSLHEAWLEAKLSDNWKIKLGRQELNFDNARFLGNLDWALQARAHDFGLLKYEKDEMKIQVGGGYNQDGQQLTGNIFTVPNQYKLAQLARFENKWGNFQLAFLFWNDGRQFVETDLAGAMVGKGIRHRQTIGLPAIKYQAGNTLFSGFYYHQLGKDPLGRKVNAWDVSAQVTQQLDVDAEAEKKLRLVAGFEILSGTSNRIPPDNNSFSPLYGTNHAHNGYMDLFYVGGAHENSVGLQDYFLKARYDFGPKFFTQLDGHLFFSQADYYAFGTQERMSKYLGTEADVSVGYIFNQAISLQGGYSQFFYSDTFEELQNNGSLKNNQNWAYLMLIFRPTMKNKFIGILL